MTRNEWNENSVYVLETIKEIKTSIDQIFDKLTIIEIQLSGQKIKQAIFTTGVALIVSPIIVIIVEKLIK